MKEVGWTTSGYARSELVGGLEQQHRQTVCGGWRRLKKRVEEWAKRSSGRRRDAASVDTQLTPQNVLKYLCHQVHVPGKLYEHTINSLRHAVVFTKCTCMYTDVQYSSLLVNRDVLTSVLLPLKTKMHT